MQEGSENLLVALNEHNSRTKRLTEEQVIL